MSNKICRYCGKSFNIKKEPFELAAGRYAHAQCHKNFEAQIEGSSYIEGEDSKKEKKADRIRICFYCKEKFNVDEEGYRMARVNRYAHINCYNLHHSEDDDFVDAIYDYLSRNLRYKYNYHVVEQQRQNFISLKSFTNKGIYFALKYFYEIKKGDISKAKGGIGIVSYVYEDSKAYWGKVLAKQKRMAKDLTSQVEKITSDPKKKIITELKKEQEEKNDLLLLEIEEEKEETSW